MVGSDERFDARIEGAIENAGEHVWIVLIVLTF